MSFQAQLAMLLWPLVVLYIFNRFSAQKAVIISFMVGILFLPQRAGFVFVGLPDYTKLSAAAYFVFLGILIFDIQKFKTFKFCWLDVPMLIFCFCPTVSSLTNGLGLYDGLSSSLQQIVPFGLPYFIGRLYLNNAIALKEWATYVFIGGLIYTPLCLFEVRISPILHLLVYGYLEEGRFGQSFRGGTYRPIVFMEHGLAVAMWMFAALVCGFLLWRSGILRRIWNIPLSIALPIMLVTFLLLKSVGAYVYLLAAVFVYVGARYLKTRLPLLIVIFAMISYIFMGATGLLYEDTLVENIGTTVTALTNQERAESLLFRMNNDEQLSEKSRERLWFGWGGWKRNRIVEENADGDLVDLTVSDSLWGIIYGTNGLVGLVAFFSSFLLPALIFAFKYSARVWLHPKIVPAFAVAVIVTLYMLDCSFNAIPNPMYILAVGGLVGFLMTKARKATGYVIYQDPEVETTSASNV